MENVVFRLLITGIITILVWIIYFKKKRVFDENTPIKNGFSIHGRKYDLDNLIGYSYKMCYKNILFQSDFMNRKTPKLILYFENNENVEVSLMNEDKEYIENLLKEKHNSIEQKNIEKIINFGLKYKFDLYQYITFKKECIEIIWKHGIVETYYYEKDIKNMKIVQSKQENVPERYVSEMASYLKIEFIDEKTIRLWDYEVNGGVGLFTYLTEKVKCPNGA